MPVSLLESTFSGDHMSEQPQQPAKEPAPAAPSINGWNGAYVDELYQQWQTHPETVSDQWRSFFEGFDLGYRLPANEDGGEAIGRVQVAVNELIHRYRDVGHLAAKLDPLHLQERTCPDLDPAAVGLAETDLDTTVQSGDLPLEDAVTVREVIQFLQKTWCGSVGAEISHIRDEKRRRWLCEHIERIGGQSSADDVVRKRILRELQQATGLERFLMRRYIGKKWFSLEGCETLIPMLNELLVAASIDDVQEIAFGMAHRGRINVLVNTLEKSYDQLFTEFEEAWTEDFIGAGGDVKYHRGYSSHVQTDAGKPLHLSMSSNPSHLEWGHPVVIRNARAAFRS